LEGFYYGCLRLQIVVSIDAVLKLLPAIFVFFRKYPHPLPSDSSDAILKKDVNKIYDQQFIKDICVLYVIVGFINNVCLIFQKNNLHFLSIEYIVNLMLVGLKNSSTPNILTFLSPFNSHPPSVQSILASLVLSNSSPFPTCPPSEMTLRRKKNQDDDDDFVLNSSYLCALSTLQHRTVRKKKTLQIFLRTMSWLKRTELLQ
jgi:hypothetical protein